MMRSAVNPYERLLTVNSSNNGFPARIPTATDPSSNLGMISWTTRGPDIPNHLDIVPYGIGADNTTFVMRIISWNYNKSDADWVPAPLAELTCTLCGVLAVATTARYCDTITLAAGYNSNVGVEVVSPATSVLGHIIVDTKGSEKIELSFNTNSATNANALYRFL